MLGGLVMIAESETEVDWLVSKNTGLYIEVVI